MPIHDWTHVSPGGYHNFHQDWTIEIYRALNRGLLPPGFTAYTDLRVSGWAPGVIAIDTEHRASPGGLAVAAAPPSARQIAHVESEAAAYARKANRISIRHDYGQVVAIIEVISPGNKESKHAIGQFVAKAEEFLTNGVNLLIIDPFPPTTRDPNGIHSLIWDHFASGPFEPRPPDKPLTVASFDMADGLTAYVDPPAVGEVWPEAPLFLGSGRHINVPLESTYQAAWQVTPHTIRDQVEP